MDYSYIEDFKKLGFGLFCHFGLYSVLGNGEWYLHSYQKDEKEYCKLIKRFRVDENWAKDLVKAAKSAGMRYITLTCRHHEGFSLYDTKGLSDYDVMHSPTKRDLVREFVDECRKGGLVPVFYHTVIDWHNEEAKNNNWDAYFEYLYKSIEILCTNYGEIGGVWFDGTWGLPKGVSFPERIYQMIHRHQPKAIITNNTGLEALGQQGAAEIDCVTFERGKPFKVEGKERPIAGEVCDSLTDHWGYAKHDISVKSSKEIISSLLDCRDAGVNYLLNSGPKANGKLTTIEKEILKEVGAFLKVNKNVILDTELANIKAENATIHTDGHYFYAFIRNAAMASDVNVTRIKDNATIKIKTNKSIKNAIWLDNKEKIEPLDKTSFLAKPFNYGYSYGARIARFELK